MPMQEIPRATWAEFFDAFTRQHRGWQVSLDVIRVDIGAQVEARDMPFGGITLDEKSDHGPEVSIMLGDLPEQHVVRMVTGAERVRLKQNDEGADETLEILSTKGTLSVVRFGNTMPPEWLDGISLEEREGLAGQ